MSATGCGGSFGPVSGSCSALFVPALRRSSTPAGRDGVLLPRLHRTPTSESVLRDIQHRGRANKVLGGLSAHQPGRVAADAFQHRQRGRQDRRPPHLARIVAMLMTPAPDVSGVMVPSSAPVLALSHNLDAHPARQNFARLQDHTATVVGTQWPTRRRRCTSMHQVEVSTSVIEARRWGL